MLPNAMLPNFPSEQRRRLCVQTFDSETDVWSEPRRATMDDFVSLVRELSPEQQATLVSVLGVDSTSVSERLSRAEWVLDAVSDAQLAIDRFREYRKRFPEKIDDTGLASGEIPF